MSSASTWYSCWPGRAVCHRAPVRRRGDRARRGASARARASSLTRRIASSARAHVDHRVGRRDAGAHALAHLVQQVGDLAVPVAEQAERREQRRAGRRRGRAARARARRSDAPRRSRRSRARRRARSGSRPRSRAPRSSRGRTARAVAVVAGDQRDHRVGLGEAGQVVEIAVVAVRIERVAVARRPRAPSGTSATPPPACSRIVLQQRVAALAVELVGVVHGRRSGEEPGIIGCAPMRYHRPHARGPSPPRLAAVRAARSQARDARGGRRPRATRSPPTCARPRRARIAARIVALPVVRRRAHACCVTLPFRSEWDTRRSSRARARRRQARRRRRASTRVARMLLLHRDRRDSPAIVAPGYRGIPEPHRACAAGRRRRAIDWVLVPGRRVRRRPAAGSATAAATTTGCCRCCRADVAAHRRRVRRAGRRRACRRRRTTSPSTSIVTRTRVLVRAARRAMTPARLARRRARRDARDPDLHVARRRPPAPVLAPAIARGLRRRAASGSACSSGSSTSAAMPRASRRGGFIERYGSIRVSQACVAGLRGRARR